MLAVLGWQDLDLAQPAPQAGIGAAGRGLDGLVADQLVGGQPEDLGQSREMAGRGLLGVGLVVGDHPLGDADGLAEGLLVFITPDAALAAGARYTVTLNGLEDREGFLVPFTAIRFTTVPGPTTTSSGGAGRSGGSSEAGTGHQGHHASAGSETSETLDEWEWRGERRNGKPYSPWQSLPPLQAPPGVTALAGQVLRLTGQPLADVTLQIGYRRTRTDATGRFLLTDIRPGYPTLVMDGSTANKPGKTYGMFDAGVDIEPGETNVLPWTIWMPLIDTHHATRIPVPTTSEIVATTPRIPGLEARIPANIILRTRSGQPLTSITLTQIPVDRPPFPLPEGSDFFFTPQTHGALVESATGDPNPPGVRFIMPNYKDLAPGVRVDLWSYEVSRHWHVPWPIFSPVSGPTSTSPAPIRLGCGPSLPTSSAARSHSRTLRGRCRPSIAMSPSG